MNQGVGTHTLWAKASDNRNNSAWVDITIPASVSNDTLTIEAQTMPNAGVEKWLVPSAKTTQTYNVQLDSLPAQ